MKKRKLSTLLLVAALFVQLAACQSISDNPPPGVLTDSDSVDSNLTETDDGFSLPDTDWGEREFRVLGFVGDFPQFSTFEIFSEKENGEIVNDAIYRRNIAIEEKYNVKVTEVFFSDGAAINSDNCNTNVIRKHFLAGEDLYDVAFNTISKIGTLAREDLVYDMNDVEYINFNAPWWNKSANDAVSMLGKQYFASSDFSLRDKSRAYIGVYNKELIKKYNFDDPIQLVRDGKWTIDVLTNWALQVSNDLNGNGEVDDQDQFGVVADSYNAFRVFVTACGNQTIAKDSSGTPTIAVNSERTSNSIDKVLKLTERKDVTIFCDEWQGKVDYSYWGVSSRIFKAGHALFCTAFPHSLAAFSADCVDDYGIIPFPKYDEEQENYYTYADVYCMLFCIPKSNPDPDFAGFMLEALSHEATDTSLHAYYEVSCKTKYTYDEDSAEMLDLIFSNIVYDNAKMFQISGISDIIYKIASKRTNSLASDYASIESKALADIEKLIDDLSQ